MEKNIMITSKKIIKKIGFRILKDVKGKDT
jgi:hypothetical protein